MHPYTFVLKAYFIYIYQMYLHRELESEDEDQWLDGMDDKINNQPEIKEAVKVQDPI